MAFSPTSKTSMIRSETRERVMRRKISPCSYIIGIILIYNSHAASGKPIIQKVRSGIHAEYSGIGFSGDAKVTITGSGFAKSQFSLSSDKNIGNTVTLMSKYQSYPCKSYLEGTTEKQIQFWSPILPAAEDTYRVSVAVDGKTIPDADICSGNPWHTNCVLKTKSDYHVRITKFSPNTGPPDIKLSVYGLIRTDRWGSSTENGTNGKVEKITRMYMSSYQLNPYDPAKIPSPDVMDEKPQKGFYKFELDSDSSNWGTIEAKMVKCSFVGEMDPSILVESPYGRLHRHEDIMFVRRNQRCSAYESHAVLTGLNVHEGSTEGGTKLCVQGNFLQQVLHIAVGGVDIDAADIYKITDEEVCFFTPPQPLTVCQLCVGNRNPHAEIFLGLDSNLPLSELVNLTRPSNLTLPADPEFPGCFDFEKYDEKFHSRIRGFFWAPTSGEYMFSSYVDDKAEIYLSTDQNMPEKQEKILYVPYSTSYKSESQRIYLEKDGMYAYTVVHYNQGGSADFCMRVMMYNTTLRRSDVECTNQVKREQQQITLQVDHLNDITKLEFEAWPDKKQTLVKEKQTLEITSTSGSGFSFRLGLDDAYTIPLTDKSSKNSIQGALNNLPTLFDDTVSVVKEDIANGMRITVTFNSKKGKFSMLTVDDKIGQIDVSVSRTVTGVSSLEQLSLEFGGMISRPIDVLNPQPSEIKLAMLDTISVQCPKDMVDLQVSKSSNNKHFLDFEANHVYNKRYGGVRTTARPAFCGRASMTRLQYLYHTQQIEVMDGNIDILWPNVQWLCFGYISYSGKQIGSKMRFYYTLKSSGYNDSTTVMVGLTASEWTYHCIDMSSIPDVTRTGKLTAIRIYRYAHDYSIDNVYIGNTEWKDLTGLTKYRRVTSSYWPVSDVDVTGDVAGVFNIKLTPHTCNYSLPHIKVYNGDCTGNSVCRGEGWPTGAKVNTTRIQAASPPLGGTFGLSYENNSREGLAYNISTTDLATALTLLQTGQTGITLVHDYCYKRTFTIDFTEMAGDCPPIQGSHSDLTGDNSQVKIVTKADGGVLFDKITSGMLRSCHANSQVTVNVNGISSLVSPGINVDFSWSDAATPTLISSSLTQGSDGDTLVIQGTKFTANISVVIGGTSCTVTDVSDTNITCTLGQGPAGNHVLKVNDQKQGLAKHPNQGNLMFAYLFNITNISPSTGWSTGGQVVTISGYGFGPHVQVTIGGQECEKLMSSYNEIKCITPRINQGTPGNEYNVSVTDSRNNIATLIDGFRRDDTNAAIITAITPSVVTGSTGTIISVTPTKIVSKIDRSCAGKVHRVTNYGLHPNGTEITISGDNFTSNQGTVKLGGSCTKEVPVTSWYNSQIKIVVGLSICPLGSYPLLVKVPGYGHADTMTNNIADIKIILEVNKVEPLIGSMVGGTIIEIEGEGFGDNKTAVEVKVGAGSGTIISVTPTKIVSKIDRSCAGKVHRVTNYGLHPKYGKGYAWKPALLTIGCYECVEWVWNNIVPSAPDKDPPFKYLVQQTEDDKEEKYDGQGFFSTKDPRGTARGKFQHQFTQSGQYPYWSGCVDVDCLIVARGRVDVLCPPPNPVEAANVVVLVQGVAAHHNITQSNGSNGTCNGCGGASGSISGITGCPHDNSTTCNDTNTACFKYDYCHTPLITNISHNNGASTDRITFTGYGFGENQCQNNIYFSGEAGQIVDSGSNRIVATMDPNTNASVSPVSGLKKLACSVCNYGYAVIDSTMAKPDYLLMPHINATSPMNGSTAGGTDVEILGGGFRASSVVKIDGYLCSETTYIDYNTLHCKTLALAHSDTPRDLTVVDYEGQNEWTAECRMPQCSFAHLATRTPVVDAVEPSILRINDHQIKINGSNLGTAADLSVTIGDYKCDNVAVVVADTYVTCDANFVAHGSLSFKVTHSVMGLASATKSTIQARCSVSTVSPASGSTQGGLEVVFQGYGLVAPVTVTVNGVEFCTNIRAINTTSVTCVTKPMVAGNVQVVVSSGGQCGTLMFSYDAAITPTITSISPQQAYVGDAVVISGTGLSTNGSVSVDLGGAPCIVTSSSDTEINCTTQSHPAGGVAVSVSTSTTGLASGNLNFTYLLQVNNISMEEGSFGGCLEITVKGNGFDPNMPDVSICGSPCGIKPGTVPTSSEIVCITPPHPGSGTVACNVTVTSGTVEATNDKVFTYTNSKTSKVLSVSPRRGGTGGGTQLTITGTGFKCPPNVVNVTINNTECVISTCNSTEIRCETEPRRPWCRSHVNVYIEGEGCSTHNGDDALFEYIDVWSSNFTWGGGNLPEAGDFVVISPEHRILLDIDTPILKLLLIRGGQLVFDRKDLQLHAGTILITDGGLLEVGTEEEPFMNSASITLHGQPREPELPVYGAKVLAVRDGSLSMHGKPVITWTILAETALPNSTQIVLSINVDWKVGNTIVIATTGHSMSQIQTEKRTIASISVNNKNQSVITLNEKLVYKHLGETIKLEEAGNYTLETRAEVGLLDRNIVVKGSDDVAWHIKIEACPESFDVGEFAVQSCFQGRFGEETGSDQYGGHVMMGHEAGLTGVIPRANIEYVEFTNTGQAFRIGRYTVHFHMIGDASGSYVRGCSMHRTFNRAVNIHGTNNVLLEYNVIYNVMGGSVFLEDGVEMGNIIQYNLAVFVKASSSLQNDDVTPAAFWLTNPNNTVQHNHVAGGTHFGFWYRMKELPDGPSRKQPQYQDMDPQLVDLGVFYNNTVHSCGWIALWLFEHYYPVNYAKFESLTAWNNEMGMQFFFARRVKFILFKLVNNRNNAVEGKWVRKHNSFSDGVIFKDLVIAAGDTGGILESFSPTLWGMILPYEQGTITDGVVFINFHGHAHAIRVTTIRCISGPDNGGFVYLFYRTSKINSPNVVHGRWESEFIIIDGDGTLTDFGPNSTLVVTSPHLPSNACVSRPDLTKNSSSSLLLSVCNSSIKFHRMSWNNPSPTSLSGKAVTMTNVVTGKSVACPHTDVRIVSDFGWMCILVGGETYEMTYTDGNHFTNISYDAIFSNFKEEDNGCVKIRHNYTQRIDRVTVKKYNQIDPPSVINDKLQCGVNCDGQYSLDNRSYVVDYMVAADECSNARKKRAMPTSPESRIVQYSTKQCFYPDCQVPLRDSSSNKADRSKALYWSNDTMWEVNDNKKESGVFGQSGSVLKPVDGEIVIIGEADYVILDISTASLDNVFIYGCLEVLSGSPTDIVFTARNIYIDKDGELIVGTQDVPFIGNAELYLTGRPSDEEIVFQNGGGPNVGTKAIGVFGKLTLHGRETTSCIPLAQSAIEKSKTLELGASALGWKKDDVILVTPTAYEPRELEIHTIKKIESNNVTIKLKNKLEYDHMVHEQPLLLGKPSYKMAAEVCLITRNVKIRGQKLLTSDNAVKKEFGVRVLVGTYLAFQDGEIHEGKGSAKISNVQFEFSGQEGYTDSFDPRCSLAFLNLGDVSGSSYVRDSSFSHGFSPAICVYGTHSLNVIGNVIHHTIGAGIIISKSRKANLTSNVVTLTLWESGYYDQPERFAFDWTAGIDVTEADDLVLIGNTVTGVERAAYSIKGEACGSQSQWRDNVAQTCLIGVYMMGTAVSPCAQVHGFIVIRAFDFGIYYQGSSSIEFNGCIVIDSHVAIFPFITANNKYTKVSDCNVVGQSDIFSCTKGKINRNTRSFKESKSGRGLGTKNDKMHTNYGVILTTTSGPNGAPKFGFKILMAFPDVAGYIYITDSGFSNYGTNCAGNEDIAIRTNPLNQDIQHPALVGGLVWRQVSNRFYMDKPLIDTVALGLDMPTDGMRQVLLIDPNGTLIERSDDSCKGQRSLISIAEYMWGNQKWGLGDYRIPAPMQVDTNGVKLPMSSIKQGNGIARHGSCIKNTAWNCYSCCQLEYGMLVVDSLDPDHLDRRISPLAVLCNGIMNLVNGVGKRSWGLRESMMSVIVPLGTLCRLFLTGTVPQSLEIQLLLNEDKDRGVHISLWYKMRTRINVFCGDIYILPLNVELNENGREVFLPPDAAKPNQFIPDPSNPLHMSGTNYFDRDSGELHVLVRGDCVLLIEMDGNVVIIGFNVPAMSVNEFFGPNIVSHLATFFNIPEHKIKYSDPVRESKRRRRRDVSETNTTAPAEDIEMLRIQIEISNSPVKNKSASTPEQELSSQQMLNIYDELSNPESLVVKQLEKELNTTIQNLTVSEPIPSSNSTDWLNLVNKTDANLWDNILPPPEPTVATEEDAMSGGAIAGIVIGCIVPCVIVVVVYLVIKTTKDKKGALSGRVSPEEIPPRPAPQCEVQY